MSVNAGQFRGAIFGGFHRQDVLDYLEKLNEDHRQELELQRAEQEAASARALAERDEEITELKRQIAALIPQAESWQKLRETAGEITVSAHEQAQTTIEQANARARTTLETADQQAAHARTESVRWVREVRERCEALQEALHRSVLLAEEELDTAKASFRRAESDLQGFRFALSDLEGSIADDEGREKTGEKPEGHGLGAPCPEKSRRETDAWID